jgi:hypothetical protein
MANTITVTGVAVDPAKKVTIPSQTVKITIPSQTINVTISSQTVNVPASNDAVSLTLDLQSFANALLPYLTIGVVTPPNTNTTTNTTNTTSNTSNTVTPPAANVNVANVFWGYNNGVRGFAGDFTQSGTTVNYSDNTGSTGTDILFTSPGPWGLFLPYFASNYALPVPTPPWTHLTIALKPSIANQIWNLWFEKVGDTSVGNTVIIGADGKYGPAPQANVWAFYNIPFTDLGIDKETALYKFGIQDHALDSTGNAVQSNHWWMDKIGFFTQASTFWVYKNGQFNWAGDYSWLASINYKDTVGDPGNTDIAVSITGQWGGFQPYAQGGQFDTSPYKYITFTAKPTVAGQVYGMGIAATGDVADGVSVTVGGGTYGPAPVVGQWSTYNVLLADFKLTNPLILKFAIADGTGNPTNLFYLKDVGFTA